MAGVYTVHKKAKSKSSIYNIALYVCISGTLLLKLVQVINVKKVNWLKISMTKIILTSKGVNKKRSQSLSQHFCTIMCPLGRLRQRIESDSKLCHRDNV